MTFKSQAQATDCGGDKPVNGITALNMFFF